MKPRSRDRDRGRKVRKHIGKVRKCIGKVRKSKENRRRRVADMKAKGRNI